MRKIFNEIICFTKILNIPEEHTVNFTDFDKNIVEYIAGAISRSVASKLSCNTCKYFLLNSGTESEFISFKEKFCLVYPTKDVSAACKMAEIELKTKLDLQICMKKDFFPKIRSNILNRFFQ